MDAKRPLLVYNIVQYYLIALYRVRGTYLQRWSTIKCPTLGPLGGTLFSRGWALGWDTWWSSLWTMVEARGLRRVGQVSLAGLTWEGWRWVQGGTLYISSLCRYNTYPNCWWKRVYPKRDYKPGGRRLGSTRYKFFKRREVAFLSAGCPYLSGYHDAPIVKHQQLCTATTPSKVQVRQIRDHFALNTSSDECIPWLAGLRYAFLRLVVSTPYKFAWWPLRCLIELLLWFDDPYRRHKRNLHTSNLPIQHTWFIA